MQFEIMDFQHIEADGNETLTRYARETENPTCAGAEAAINQWVEEMVYNSHLDDVQYVVTVEEDEGQFIAIISNDDLPLILYSALPS